MRKMMTGQSKVLEALRDVKKEEIPPKPKPLMPRFLYDGDYVGNKICKYCGSSLHRKSVYLSIIFDFRSKKCVNEKCENYIGK